MECPNCQTENREGANFCRRCGRLLVGHCPRCRVDLLPDSDYCDNCNLPLSAQAAAGWPAVGSAPGAVRAMPGPAQAAVPPIRREAATPKTAQSGAPGPKAAGMSAEQISRHQKLLPRELAAKFEEARASGAMEGERRVVTILFCDVKGSTAAAEQLDPEEWTGIINGAFDYMISPVYKYEGTIARLMGDSVLAFFGAPIAHEDDPQRAVLAGLDIASGIDSYRRQVEREWGIDFNVRVGINTGLVVVGGVGSDMFMEYTAMGDAINLAARMEQTAEPGSVRIAQATYELVAPLFEFEELGAVEVKGKEQAVAAYRVLRRKKVAGRLRGLEGLEIALIGRDEEMAGLEAVMTGVRQGVGGIVCVMGEAGLGKSRLIRELRTRQGAGQGEDETPDWYETTSLSYETAQPYALFQRLIRRLNDISHVDSPAVRREKLSKVAGLFPEEQQSDILQLFEALFSMASENGRQPLEGEAFRESLFKWMPELWRRRFAGRPAVLFFDDLHWSDPASIALLQHLLPLVEEMALVFLCAFRADRKAPGWEIKTTADESYRHRYTELILRPLSAEQSRQMVYGLLGDPEMPAGLLNRILERAGGNPFYIEEVIRSLIVRGALVAEDDAGGGRIWRVSDEGADIDIPSNLQSLLTARIDNLSEETRQTLQMASVVGRSFYRRVLALVDETSAELDAHIQTLLRQEMIRETARIPEVEYSFRNPLTQEAAYGTILLKRRREFHQRVGEAMETLFPDRLGELGPQLAHHFREAGDFEKALTYFRQAGDAAYRLYANAEAVTQYGQALEMARKWEMAGQFDSESQAEPAYSDTLLHLYGRRGRALEHLVAHEDALDNYRAMSDHAEKLADRPLALAAMIAKATLYSTATAVQDSTEARQLSEEALDIAHGLGDRAAEAKIYWNLMNSVAFSGGDVEEGLAYGRSSLEIARELDLREQIAYTLGGMALLHMASDQIREAQKMMPEVSAIWRDLDNKPMLADSYSLQVAIRIYMQGTYTEAIPLAKELEQISQSINNSWNLMVAKRGLGVIYIRLGEIGRSLGYLQEALALGEETGHVASIVMSLTELAEANELLGDNERAHALAKQAVSQYADVPQIWQSSYLAIQAAIFVRVGDLDQARTILDELLNGDPKTRYNAWQLSLISGAKAELALAEGRPGNAVKYVEAIVPRLSEIDMRVELPRLLYLRGQAHLALGDLDAAAFTLGDALTESVNTGEMLWRWRILAALLPLAEGLVAAEWRQQAIETVKFIAEHAPSEELRSSFRQRADVAALLAAPAQE